MAILAPVITGSANVDDISTDIVLAAMPIGATAVDLWAKTATAFDQLVHTFVAPGTKNDTPHAKYALREYVAVANDGASDYSPPSTNLQLQVGTNLKYTMGAHIVNVANVLRTDPTLMGWNVDVREWFVDPPPSDDTIYVLPEVESPDQPYANQRLETELPLKILVTTVIGDGRTASAHNEEMVARVLRLLAVNYKWGCNAYTSEVNAVDYNAEQEGWQPENPVASIIMTAHSQYARYIGA